MSRQPLGRVALLAAAALVLAVLLPATAAAARGTYPRLAHLSPDTIVAALPTNGAGWTFG